MCVKELSQGDQISEMKIGDIFNAPVKNPSIHFLYRQSVGRVAGGLEPIPEIIRRKAGYTLDMSQVHNSAT